MPSTGVKRAVRVADQIRSELMELLLRGVVRDPRAQGLLVTRVRVTDDLQQATAYVRRMEAVGPKERKEVVAVMRGAAGFVRRELGQRLSLKYTPALEFRWDDGVDNALRVEAILEEIRQEDERVEE